MRTSRMRATVVLGAAAALLLAGCAGTAPDPAPSSAAPANPAPTTSVPAPATESPAAEPSRPACSDLTGQEALLAAIDEVQPAFPADSPLHDHPWDTDHADTDHYDPCAALSWIVITVEGATVSSPAQILLFHRGEYLGTTTWQAYGFWPAVERLDDATIRVTYRWPLEGEGNAEPSGRAESTFTWDADEQRVIHAGELPPDRW